MKMRRMPECVLVAHLFPELLEYLIAVLTGLRHEDWQKPTSSAGWSVHDVALHLLGGDVGQLSAHRDKHEASVVRMDQWQDLLNRVNEQNEEWVAAARRISPALLIDLLKLTGEQVNRFSQIPHLTLSGRAFGASSVCSGNCQRSCGSV